MRRQAPSHVYDDVCNFQLLRDHFDHLVTGVASERCYLCGKLLTTDAGC